MPKQISDINDQELQDAIDKIISSVQVDSEHDIPYLAGYSVDGKTIYIDRHIPPQANIEGHLIQIWQTLVCHEAIEKAILLDYGVNYLFAHQIALRVERDLVEADGVSWQEYSNFLEPYIKRAEKEKLNYVPICLDLEPYRDYNDYETLKRLLNAE